jgi:hypothetical protein
MKTASNFSAWSISSAGGSSSTWRIYAGSTTPLLRTFLTSLATDKTTTYTGAVQYGIGYGLSNITGTYASGTNAGTYYSSTLYSNQQGYDLSGSGTLIISVPTSSSVGSSTTVLEPDSETFPLPPRGRSAVLIEGDSASTGGGDQSEFDLHQASGG